MRNIFLLLSSLIVTNGLLDLDCSHSDNCNAEPNMYEIVCDANTKLCTCTFDTGTCPTDPLPDYDALDSAKCQELCTDGCAFYKWTKANIWDEAPNSKHCYHMDENQCQSIDSHGCDGATHCVSGANEDMCDGTNTIPPTPTPAACFFIDGFEYDKSGESLHWLCGVRDAYDGTLTADSGTICSTHHSCKKYDKAGYTLQYECIINNDGDGEWKTKKGDGEDYLNDVTDEVDVDDGQGGGGTIKVRKLKEPSCGADALSIPAANYGQAGLLITCSEADAITDPGNDSDPVTITASTCLLLCDFYPIMSFSPGWNPTEPLGERVWLYEMEGGLTGPNGNSNGVLDGNDVKCWDD